ncbi:TPA: type I toxin-antitoxin system toxin Ldr family protein, partial [Escherichia coli]
ILASMIVNWLNKRK